MNTISQTRWAGVLVLKDRKVLTLKETNKNFFQLPGGKMELGETPEETTRREVMEELGVTVKNLKFFIEVNETAKTSTNQMVFKLFTGDIEAIPDRSALPPKTESVQYIAGNYKEQVGDIGNLLKFHIIPLLQEGGLID